MSHVHHTPITELPADDLPDEEVVLSDPERVPSFGRAATRSSDRVAGGCWQPGAVDAAAAFAGAGHMDEERVAGG